MSCWSVQVNRPTGVAPPALPQNLTPIVADGARQVVRDPARIAYVDFPEAYVLMDMDTPEDYARCLEEWGKRETTRRRAAEGHA